jgi:hypothetical protein
MYLTKERAKELGLRLIGRKQGTFAGGRTASVHQGILSELSLASVRVANLPVLVPETIGQIDIIQFDGIIGSQVLSQFISTFDFRKRTLKLESRHSFSQHANIAKDSTIVEGRIFNSHIFVIPASVEGKTGHYFVDCGGTFGVAPDARGWRRISSTRAPRSVQGVSGAGHKINYRIVQDVEVCIHHTSVANVSAVGGIFPRALKKLPVRIDGIISQEALSRFDSVTFDFDLHRILFHPRDK